MAHKISPLSLSLCDIMRMDCVELHELNAALPGVTPSTADMKSTAESHKYLPQGGSFF